MVQRCGICGKPIAGSRYRVVRGLMLCSEDTGYADYLAVSGEVLKCSCGYAFSAGDNRIWYKEHRCANCGADQVAVYLHIVNSRDRVNPQRELLYVVGQLVLVEEPRVVKALISVLEDDTADGQLKANVAKTLGRIGDPSIIPVLKKARPRISLADFFLLWLPEFFQNPRDSWPPSGIEQHYYDQAIERLQAKADKA